MTSTYTNRMRVALSLQQPTGLWTNGFTYDAARRVSSVTSPAGTFSYYFRSPAGPLITGTALPNGSQITNVYDPDARLLSTILKTSGGTTLDSALYGYNSLNQRTTFTNAAGTYYQFSYDNIGQLKVADSSLNTEDRGYKYDAAWNLNWRTNNGAATSLTVDSKNQLLTFSGSSFSYDGNGNLLTNSYNGIDYSYDDENRLINVEDYISRAFRSAFTYDGLGRLRKRIDYTWTGSKWNPSGTVTYVYDGNRVIQERDGSNNPVVSYTRGTDLSGSLEGAGGIGGLLARSSGYSAGNWTSHAYYHADGNGNITYLETSAEGLGASYRYDPFGNTMSSSGTLASANVYRFSSKEIHVNTLMYHYLYRFYDPQTQRWINRDPIGEMGGLNLSRFAGNTPTTDFDPVGWSNVNDPPSSVGEPGPILPGGRYPPGYKPSWPRGIGEPGEYPGPYVQDPDTGRKFWPHPENPRQWPHYHWKDPNGQTGHYPEKCDKPWSNQTRPPYGHQSPNDPWPAPPRQPRFPWEDLWRVPAGLLFQMLEPLGGAAVLPGQEPYSGGIPMA